MDIIVARFGGVPIDVFLSIARSLSLSTLSKHRSGSFIQPSLFISFVFLAQLKCYG